MHSSSALPSAMQRCSNGSKREQEIEMLDAVNNSAKQKGRPFRSGVSGNPHGRPRGSRNKRTRALVEAAQAGGEMPLDYMLRVMRDRNVTAKRRDEMAKAAAPFLHPKLASIEQHGSADMPPVLTHIRVSFVKPDGTEVNDLDEATKP
jgi:Family of unknown function (DUF5681)